MGIMMIKSFIFSHMQSEDLTSILLSIVSECPSTAGWIFLKSQISNLADVVQASSVWFNCLEISDDEVFTNLIGLILSERNNQPIPRLSKSNSQFQLNGTLMPSGNNYFKLLLSIYSNIDSPTVFIDHVFNALIAILCDLPHSSLYDSQFIFTWSNNQFTCSSIHSLFLELITHSSVLPILTNIPCFNPRNDPVINNTPNQLPTNTSVHYVYEHTIIGSICRFGLLPDYYDSSNLFLSTVSAISNLPASNHPILDPELHDLTDPPNTQLAHHYLSHCYSESINSSKSLFRNSHNNVVSALFNSFKLIFKSNPTNKSNLLQFIALLLNNNHLRCQTQINPLNVSSNNLLSTLTSILCLFVAPLHDKPNLIDLLNLNESPLIDISEDTMLFANAREEVCNATSALNSAPSFSTSIFLLASNALCLSFIQTTKYYMNDKQSIISNNNPLAPQFIQFQSKLIINSVSRYLAWDCGLMNNLTAISEFYTLQINLLSAALNEKLMIPEWMVENIIDFHLFIMRQYKYDSINYKPVIEFMITISNCNRLKNPWLKSKCVELLFLLSMIPNEPILNQYILLPNIVDLLLPCLIPFYCMVEQTGLHNQFYDKFNIRHYTSKLIEYSIAYVQHMDKLIELSNDGLFIKFVNLLMNDTTYLLDEGFSKLKTITELEASQHNGGNDDSDSPQNTENVELLASTKRQAKSLIQLANMTSHLLDLLTAKIKKPFLCLEIVDRLASMVDYNLELLVGVKCTTLKVKDPKQYQFEPKTLVMNLANVIVHLGHSSEFQRAMANDARSFKIATFKKVGGVLKRTNIASSIMIEELEQIVITVDGLQREMEMDNEEEDCPDEFMDSLMFFCMNDPVILPTSKNVVDRSTITTHLLSDGHDPFNRQPLKIEECIEDVELKKKIMEWRRERRIKRLGNQ
eukprot:NODE_159_length_16647_cov_0.251390.p1 type:complete len:918 gc:universal NODE_159_length_16647_cov_0.251390:11514-14267(+)